MPKKNNFKLLLFALLLELFVFPKPAKAYLDPGSASFLFQILIAGALGALFYIKSIIKWFKGLFTGPSSKKESKFKNEED